MIVDRVEETLNKHDIDYDLKWTFNGKPFITEKGTFLTAVQDSVTEQQVLNLSSLLQAVLQMDVLLLLLARK